MITNLEANVKQLLDKHSVEDIVFALYCYADDRARMEGKEKEKFKLQARALDTACEIMDEENDTYCLVY